MFIQLFDSVKVTKGTKNSIIFDSQNNFIRMIPNEFCDLLLNKYTDFSFLFKK